MQMKPESDDQAPGASQVHQQKLECALQLARTVALDFNNALTGILGHTSWVLGQMEPSHPWRASLLEVEKAAARAAEIASDLGAFSRQDREPKTQAAGNLNQLLQRTVEYFERQAGTASAQWHCQFEPHPFAAPFDEAKLQQAFVRILENSLESLPGSGRISIRTRNLDLAAPLTDQTVTLAPGAYVCAEIMDTGGGIEPGVLPRVFEPFFTTKSAPHRGLGLTWVYGIVTNHGGGVAITSQPREGTVVRVYLPAEKRVLPPSPVAAGELGGNQSILMVDDEDILLTMGQTILSACGYRVQTANSGQKAFELLNGNDHGVDLVITDLVMPGMGGRELIEHIRLISPQTRILCTSGYVWPASQEPDAAYLQKPFTSQDLLLKVKQVLGQGAGSPAA